MVAGSLRVAGSSALALIVSLQAQASSGTEARLDEGLMSMERSFDTESKNGGINALAYDPYHPYDPYYPSHMWHCQAYPNGSGHHHSHDAWDVNRSVAYNRAYRSCRYYHYSCHVHCHLDHYHP